MGSASGRTEAGSLQILRQLLATRRGVVGFDGVPEAARSTPPLTTIAQPIAELGRRAVEAILRYDGEVHRETLPVELVVRGSTAPPPK